MIRFVVGNTQLDVKTWSFPAGEVGVSLPIGDSNRPDAGVFSVHASLRTSDEVMQLLMAVDAFRREYPNAQLHANIPFIPYARQDRVCNEGESLSAAVIAKLLNSCGFNSITTCDPHSDVLAALLANVSVRPQEDIVRWYKRKVEPEVVVAPDAGALKKAGKVAAVMGCPLAFAHKVRDMSTGKIVSYDFHGDVKGKRVLVVDDLCDGGATFVQLGEKLAEAGVAKSYLYVTHGIFTKGVDVLKPYYDEIHTTNSYHYDRVGRVDGVLYKNVY